jgi:Eco57I restriction-modification methylase/Type I restriction enzyme R protein N terminus (HSDR_N)
MSVAPKQIRDLVQRFERNLESYQSQAYNETQLRREFIDPLFEALGWDVTNKAGYAEAYKDVIHEDAIKVGSATKAPDYCFRIGGARKFFLEAKKPAVSIKDEAGPAYQLRRYAWSAKLPLSILTNFEEFGIYDCRIPPKHNDKPSIGRILFLAYREYATRWDEIASIFSKDAVLKGSFDKYVVSGKGKRGTSEVDAEFLIEIESWRDALAKNLALRNLNLPVRDLNFAVQRTIDRIIFLRMCEDRAIESYGQLMALLNGENTYKRLQYIYGLADDRYNSGLFHFKPEKGRAEAPDELTLTLTIDDKVLKDIIRRLYYPESPYEFSVLSADILGNVYEQFLGKVIRLTVGHQAKVEEKPEVKKAGGIYYTPVYIVDYIVKNTVGKLCEGKTPKQISKLRILDPACGSGSFLIGAYTYLLNYHRDWYVKDGTEKHTKGIYQGAGGQWLLTTQEKKRILLNNIYGVDIDSQAVEVTKLSLLLKVLEGENQQTLASQLRMWRERALPDLGSNIKCGNSLIGPDYYEGRQATMFDDEEVQRVNAFDWNAEFQEIMKTGGFDAVIGNPPYIRIQTMKEWAPVEVELYKLHYAAASKGNYDIYVVFVEKGLQLLSKTGRLGFILPHKFFQLQYGEPLRKLIADGKHLAEVVHFGSQQVFASSTTYTCLLFLDKGGATQVKVQKVNDLEAWKNVVTGTIHGLFLLTPSAETGFVAAKAVTASEWNFVVGKSAGLFEKLRAMPVKLGTIADIFVGLQTSADDVYILELIKESRKEMRLKSKVLDSEVILEKDLLFPLVSGTDIGRYEPLPERQFILFPYRVQDESPKLIE